MLMQAICFAPRFPPSLKLRRTRRSLGAGGPHAGKTRARLIASGTPASAQRRVVRVFAGVGSPPDAAVAGLRRVFRASRRRTPHGVLRKQPGSTPGVL